MIMLIIVFSVACFTLLAPWQFGVNNTTQAEIKAVERSQTEAPKPLQQVLPNGQAPSGADVWTKVTLHGSYLPAYETIAWLREVNSDPAMEVLTPFRLDNGAIVLVDRGYLRPANTTSVPPFAAAPSGPRTLVARVRQDETDSDHRPVFQRDGHRWTYAVSSRIVGAALHLNLDPGYFELTPGQPGVLNPLPLPSIDSGPYFSYALQWITFGIMAPLGIGYLIYAELHPQDDSQQEGAQQEGASDESPRVRRRRPVPFRRSGRMSVAERIAEEERQEREEAEAASQS